MGRGKAGESGGFAAALSCSVYVETQVIPNATKWSEESRLSHSGYTIFFYTFLGKIDHKMRIKLPLKMKIFKI